MRIWKKILVSLAIICTLLVLAYVSLNLFFSIQGKSYALQIPIISYIIRLGKSPKISFPNSIQGSFSKLVSNGRIIYAPMYVDDAIVDKEENGDIYAHDVRTGEKKLYYWQDETAYICVDTRTLRVLTGENDSQTVDPKEVLGNFHFVYNEDGVRGDQLLSGLSHFESDVEPGQPIKLILKNREKNQDGAYDLVGIYLFISKDCSNYPI